MYLGLDASSQSLSACLLDPDSYRIVHECSLRYDEALPHYGTRNGVCPDLADQEAMAPPLMWVEALDLLFAEMKQSGIALENIRAIAGSGQQHGSVYFNANMSSILNSLTPNQSLAEQLQPGLSRPLSPVWMDSSTSAQCETLTEAAGGWKQVLDITGSKAFERFTAAQILKFMQTDPEAYSHTTSIGLVSSFHASVLAGNIAPIDWGDGSGMNLLDMRACAWSDTMCRAVSPDLTSKLPPCVPPWKVISTVSPYFVSKYGLDPGCHIAAWSGDNPNSVAGLGLSSETTAAVSLGTSDTYFGMMSAYTTDPTAGGHVFYAPNGDYMSLICFKNGSLAREAVRKQYNLTWDQFSSCLEQLEPGAHEFIMLPYFTSEIVPKVLKPGVVRHHLSEDDPAANCRAVIEAQMMSMKNHSSWMNVSPELIYATGGASRNNAILQVLADVFQARVCPGETGNAAALGAALRAAHAHLSQSEQLTWEDLSKATAPSASTMIKPRQQYAEFYKQLAHIYQQAEEIYING